jgi:hypothetical protein
MKALLKRHGMSVLEVSVALGIATFLTLASGTIMTRVMQLGSDTEIAARQSELTKILRHGVLQSPQSCASHLSLTPGPGDPLRVRVSPDPSIGLNEMVSTGANLQNFNVRVTSFRLANTRDMGSDPSGHRMVHADVVLQYESTTGGTKGKITSENIGQVLLALDATNTIRSCAPTELGSTGTGGLGICKVDALNRCVYSYDTENTLGVCGTNGGILTGIVGSSPGSGEASKGLCSRVFKMTNTCPANRFARAGGQLGEDDPNCAGPFAIPISRQVL